MLLVFYVARWAGSPWHTITVETGACAPVWLALGSQGEPGGEVGANERRRSKWGSATDRWGTPKVVRTDVEGWGLDGSGERIDWWGKGGWGRIRGAQDATKEDVETFVTEGARAWRDIEELRMEWEGRLDDYEKNQAEKQG